MCWFSLNWITAYISISAVQELTYLVLRGNHVLNNFVLFHNAWFWYFVLLFKILILILCCSRKHNVGNLVYALQSIVLMFCVALQNTNLNFVLLKKSQHWVYIICSRKYHLGILCCSVINWIQKCAAQELQSLVICVALES